MNEVKLITVDKKGYMTSLGERMNEKLYYLSENEYRLINVKVIYDERALITLQSKY